MTIPFTERKSRVYLTGFMGSGKSTIGPILANTIGYEFVDVDHSIEQADGLTVAEIFRTRGEPYFRDRERSIITEISKRPRTVVALGGGSLMDPQNLQRVVSTGILVYLNVATDEIMRRVQRKNDRPLLTDASGNRVSDEEIRARIVRLFDQRRPFYEMADLIISADEQRVGITVDRIVMKLLPLLR